MLVFEEELRKVRTTSTDFFCFLSEDWDVLKNDIWDAIKVEKMKRNSFTPQSGQSQNSPNFPNFVFPKMLRPK